MSERITFRPGNLAGPLAAYCGQHGLTPSEVLRVALARLLRVDVPVMPEGNPAFRKKQKRRRK